LYVSSDPFDQLLTTPTSFLTGILPTRGTFTTKPATIEFPNL